MTVSVRRAPLGSSVPLAYLRAIWADLVECPGRAVQEADDLVEVVIANAPGAIHQEDKICLGCFTNCMGEERKGWVGG